MKQVDTSPYIISSPESKKSLEIGGKAKNLFALQKIGMNVPDWLVFSEQYFLKILPSKLKRKKNYEGILAFIDDFQFPADFPSSITERFTNTPKFYAVRSSASDEDGANYSFAGQFDTYLYVEASSLEDKIKKVWKSAFSTHVLAYREKNNIPHKFGISVIVQEMIDAESAGVAFGINPVSGNVSEKIVTAVYGLGEGLVSGELNADTYTVSLEGIKRDIATKTHYFVQSNNEVGAEKRKLQSEKEKLSVLNDEEIKRIEEILDILSSSLQKPQDIEFAFAKGELYMLQTRPVTSTGKATGEYTLWDNSNIIESYPGVTTPLTFSFIIKMYEAVYRQFIGLLGLKEQEIEEHSEIFANTLGLIRGRVYYNLLNWYKMLAMVPGYSINAEYMENMMGVKERFILKDDLRMKKGTARLRIISMIFKMIKLQRRLPKERERFMMHLETVMFEYEEIKFQNLSSKQIVQKYLDFETSLLKEWKAPLINDFFAMIWFGTLQKLTAKHGFSEDSNIHNNLLCGSQDIISVQPIHRTMAIASMIKKDKEIEDFFLKSDVESILRDLGRGRFKEISREINGYILDFGERCIGELKLETISYSQDPSVFIKLIQTYLRQGITEKTINNDVDNKLRATAEEQVSKVLGGRILKKWFFNYVLKKARVHVSNRENLRYERTRGFGMVRKMFTELGVKLHNAGLIGKSRDIFMLEKDEIFELVEGTNSFSPLNLIEQRKKEFAQYKKDEIPAERFYTYGSEFSDAYIFSQDKIEDYGDTLQGIGCCPGRVKARVQVIKDPTEIESLNGDILVTSSTDPGWVTLFPTASAIIVERGSLLSHSAIVSREMGIPCIVSVSGLLRTLTTGDEVIMDGSTGEIAIVSRINQEE